MRLIPGRHLTYNLEGERMRQETHTAINWLSRDEIVEYLESAGFACYDTESTDDLREALRLEVTEGELNI